MTPKMGCKIIQSTLVMLNLAINGTEESQLVNYSYDVTWLIRHSG